MCELKKVKMTAAKEATKTKETKNIVESNSMPKKSICTAYFCWLFGGFWGLHYIYLGRDRQAFLWFSTLGGYFGIGLFIDLFKIPSYVREANEDPRFVEEFIGKLRAHPKPEFSTTRFLYGVMSGYLYAQLYQLAIPQEKIAGINFTYLHWFIPLFAAIAVWLVGNMGREKGVLWHCLIAAYLTYPIRYVIYDDTYWMTAMMVTCAFAFDYFSKEWRRERPKRLPRTKRFAYFTAALIIYLAVWSSYFYFNGKITDADGEEVPIREAIYNAFNSPWWTDLKQTLYDTYQFAKHNGWYETYRQIKDSLDVDGEKNSFKVLGLLPTATQGDITTAWRTLSKENHPDKEKDPSKRRAAQERFMEIQQAYEVLSKLKNRRRKKNRKYNGEL